MSASGKPGRAVNTAFTVAVVFGLVASVAHGRPTLVGPIPFSAVHLAYARVVANESGMDSSPDADGILQALLYPRNQVGTKLDNVRLMSRMVAHSPRTFPASAPYLPIGIKYEQSQQNLWTSTLTLDCAQPANWHLSDADWRFTYAPACRRLMLRTKQYLLGQNRTWCRGRPTTWGSEADMYRPGGPIERGWTEIVCDHTESDTCRRFSSEERATSPSCTRNRFWTWVKRDVAL